MASEGKAYKALMAGSAAAAAGSAGALAAYQGHIPEGIEYVNQAKDLVEPVFYDPEMTKEGATDLKDYAVGNVDTLMHGMAGAGISGLTNKVLKPGNRTKALAAGLAGGALGYTMLKEGMYEGAFSTIDLSVDSIQNAASPADHVIDEVTDVSYNADQQRDLQADTAGVLTERSMSSSPGTLSSRDAESLEPETAQGTDLDQLLEEQDSAWSPSAGSNPAKPGAAVAD